MLGGNQLYGKMRGATQREPKRSDTERLTPKVVERIKAAEENKQKLKEAQLFIAEHDLRSMLRSRDGEMDDAARSHENVGPVDRSQILPV